MHLFDDVNGSLVACVRAAVNVEHVWKVLKANLGVG